jgi:hypothetical protein
MRLRRATVIWRTIAAKGWVRACAMLQARNLVATWPTQVSIVVLPFANLSCDPSQD